MAAPRMKKSSKKAAPWFRLFASEFQASTSSLKALEKGVYVALLVEMHERGEPLHEDYSAFARVAGTTPATVKKAVELLISRDLLYYWEDGLLWSGASQREAANQEKHSELQRKKASLRWQKDEQKQDSDDAGAYRYLDSRYIDDHVPSEHGQSPYLNSYQDSTTDGGSGATREGAAPPSYRVNQPIVIPVFGDGHVYKIVSRRPYTIIARHQSDTGHLSFARMQWDAEGHGVCRAISREDADALPTISGETGHDRSA